jgi:DNA-binding Xre family transcriptional regulator
MYLHKEKEAHDSWGEKYNLLFPMFQQREDHNNNYSDSNQCKTDDGIIGRNLIHKQFREQEGVSEYAMKESVLKLVDRQRKSPVKLLILDELFGCDPESYVIHNTLCIELRKRGCAVISVISEPVIDPTFNRNLQRFMNDSSISIRKRSSAEGILTMQINVASPFDGESKFRCSLSRNGSHPNFYKVKSHKPKRADPLKWPREQLIQKVIKLDEDGLNGQEIADKIGISLSMVKKLKGVAGISETREDKRRRKERESNRALKRKPSRIR